MMKKDFLACWLVIFSLMVPLSGTAAPGVVSSEVTDAKGQVLGYGVVPITPSYERGKVPAIFVPSISQFVEFDSGGFIRVDFVGVNLNCGEQVGAGCVQQFYTSADCTGTSYAHFPVTGEMLGSSRDRRTIYFIRAVRGVLARNLRSYRALYDPSGMGACLPVTPDNAVAWFYPNQRLFSARLIRATLPFTLPVALPLNVKYSVQTFQ